MRTLFRMTASIFVLVAAPAFAAEPVLDQSAPADPAAATTLALSSTQKLIQSFTAGLTGRLAELGLPIGCDSGEVIVEIYDADPAGLPIEGTRRLHRTYDANLFPTIVTAEFQPLLLGGRVGVTAGERLAIVLSNPSGFCGIQLSLPGDAYLDGTGWYDDPTDTFPPAPLGNGTDDLAFQTFVRLTGP